MEQVDYLFVDKGLAGLRKNFDVTLEDIEDYPAGEKFGDDRKETSERGSGDL